MKIPKSLRALQLCFSQPQKERDKREGAAERQRALLVPRHPAAVRASPAAEGAAGRSGTFRAEPQGFLSSRPGCPSAAGAGSSPGGSPPGEAPGEGLAACDRAGGDAAAAGRGALATSGRHTVPAAGKGLTDACNKELLKKCRGGWRSLVGNRGESLGERSRRYFPPRLPKCYLLPVTSEGDVKPGRLMLKQKLRG